ncbi:transposase [Salmonella enterica subsp. diarizonae]|nr:transposase [Salmonella enterica subsp. diarizonae]EGV2900759.1 transposase [Salmonella enterica]EIE7938443.1 transposase [Salmonella enterica]
MGFWKTASKLAVEVANNVLSNARELKTTPDHLEDKSSAELRKITTDNVFSAAQRRRKASGTKDLARPWGTLVIPQGLHRPCL